MKYKLLLTSLLLAFSLPQCKDEENDTVLKEAGILALFDQSETERNGITEARSNQFHEDLNNLYNSDISVESLSSNSTDYEDFNFSPALNYFDNEQTGNEKSFVFEQYISDENISEETKSLLLDPSCTAQGIESCLELAYESEVKALDAGENESTGVKASWGIPGLFWFQNAYTGYKCIVPKWNLEYGLGKNFWSAAYICASWGGYLRTIGTGDTCFYVLYPKACKQK